MDLQDPRAIEVTGAEQNLLEQVTESWQELEAERPFTPEVASRLQRALLPDRVVASLNMEGIVATRRVTLQVMDAMRLEENASRAEREVLNLLRADEFVQDSVEQGAILSPVMIRQIHAILMEEVLPSAGAFRDGPVELPGAPFRPPDAGDVPGLVQELAEKFRQSEHQHPIIQAAWLHGQLAMIHPFFDGNGRAARLLQDWALIRRGLVPTGIPTSLRDDYYAALENADLGSWANLLEMLATLQLSAIARVEAVAREPQERTEWITRIAKAASTKIRNTRHKQYLVWRQRVDNLASGFQAAAEELDLTSSEVGVTFKADPGLDFADWTEVSETGRFLRTRLFSLLFFADRKPVWKAVFYARRHQWVGADSSEIAPGTVAIYVTGQLADSTDRLELLHFDDPHVTLRELVYVNDELLRYRIDSEGSLVCDSGVDINEVVRDFFMDIFGRKLGLET